MTERMRAWVHLAAGLVVTLFLGWLLLRQLDADHLVAALSALTVPSLLSALVFLAMGYQARIARWWLMLRPLWHDLALSDCVRPFLASIALNNLLPLRAGDALRVFGFLSQLKLGSPQLFGSLVVERLLDLGVLMLFFFLGVALLPAGAMAAGLDVAASWLLPTALVALCLSLLAVI